MNALISALMMCAAAAVGASANPNLLRNGSFEKPEIREWEVFGAETTGTVVQDMNTGQHSYYVADRGGGEMGQANTIRFPVETGKEYYAEARMKCDPELHDVARLDVQFFDAAGKYVADAPIGVTKATEWVRVGAAFTAPKGAATMRLRVMPAVSQRGSKGAVWVTDVVLCAGMGAAGVAAPPSAIGDDSLPAGERPPEWTRSWFPHPEFFGFEDMSGWKAEYVGKGEMGFYRSRSEAIMGEYGGRLTFKDTSSESLVRLIPPAPMALPPCDRAVVWVYGGHPPIRWPFWNSDQPVVRLVLLDGSGKEQRAAFQPISFTYWAPIMAKVDPALPRPLSLKAIEITHLGAPGESKWLCLDYLTFFIEDKSPIPVTFPPNLPFPTRPETILPATKEEVRSELSQEGGKWQFTVKGPEGAARYEYEPKTGSLEDVAFADATGKRFAVAKGGGPVFESGGRAVAWDAPEVRRELLGAEKVGNAVVARWRFSFADVAPVLTYRFEVLGRSLVVTMECDTPAISVFRTGAPDQTDVTGLAVPYLLYRGECNAAEPCVRYTADGLFISHLWDYYNSDATALNESEIEYQADTAGRRHPLRERLFITCSRDFQEVLPTIANPPSPWAKIAGRYIYWHCPLSVPGSDKSVLSLLKEVKRYGMDYVTDKSHAGLWCQFGGPEPWVDTTTVRKDWPNGEQVVKNFVKEVHALGYKVALFSDYVPLDPMNANFDERWISLNPDGTWRFSWVNAFALTPLKAWEFAAEWGPKMKAAYDVDAMYCDQMTAAVPWRGQGDRIDFDARKPFAAQLKPVFYSYGKTLLTERDGIRGPVYSEGSSHWFWAGLADGNYASLCYAGLSTEAYKAPWLVDFDLLKMHPLEFDLGMGWGLPMYGLGGGFDEDGSKTDRWLCATIAFGHYGLLTEQGAPAGDKTVTDQNSLGKALPILLKLYFMEQQLQTFYAQEPVESIRYFDGSKPVDSSAAILSGAYRRNQLRVQYRNGLTIYANGNFEAPWSVEADGRTYTLPPTGWVALLPGKILEYSANRDGGRVDFVDAPEYFYANGRGREVDFGPVRTGGTLIIKKERPGQVEAIPVEAGSVVSVRPAELGLGGGDPVNVTALDVSGKELWTRPMAAKDGWLELRREGEAFSFRLAR